MTTLKTVLIVEDEFLIALDLEEIARERGFATLSATSNDAALALIESVPFDFALLDLNMNGERGFRVAQRLLDKTIPFAFCSGSVGDPLPDDFRAIPLISKPFGIDAIAAALDGISERTPSHA